MNKQIIRVDEVKDFVYGNTILTTIFNYDTEKYEFLSFPDYKPFIFIESDNGSIDTLFGKKVNLYKFKNIDNYYDFIKCLENKSTLNNVLVEFGVDDLNKIHYDKNIKSYFVFSKEVNHYFEKEEFDYNKRDILFIDIEVLSDNGLPDVDFADKEILLITVKSNKSDKYVVFSSKDFDENVVEKTIGVEKDKIVKIVGKNEEEMLKLFINKISVSNKGFILTGWNFIKFDWLYLINRIKRLFGENFVRELIPNQIKSKYKRILIKDKKYRTYISRGTIDYIDVPVVPGLNPIDYRSIYIKYSYSEKSSYSLDHIAEEELGINKLKFGSLTLSKEDLEKRWDDYVSYNINDVILVEKLEEKLKLLNLVCYISAITRLNLEEVFGETTVWKNLIYKHCFLNRRVVPDLIEKKEKEEFSGGNVEEVIKGLHKGIVVYDFKSLYPNLIRTFNISPEVKLEKRIPPTLDDLINSSKESKLIEGDLILAGNGVVFDKTRTGIFPELMGIYFGKRQEFNKLKKENKGTSLEKVYDIYQQAVKIMINSLYGASGTSYFIYYDKDISSAVTDSGRLVAKYVIKKLNEFLNNYFKTNNKNYIIASDTDSIMIDLGILWDDNKSDEENCNSIYDYCDNVLYKQICDLINEFVYKLNANQGYLFMEQECIGIRGLFLEKKKYSILKGMEDGVKEFIGDKNKIKIRGISLVQSTVCKEFKSEIKKLLDRILSGDVPTREDLKSFIVENYNNFKNLKVEILARKMSVKGIKKYIPEDLKLDDLEFINNDLGYKIANTNKINFIIPGKNGAVPFHIKSAVCYNLSILKNKGLINNYELINEGDKISVIHAKNNEYGINYIVFKDDNYPLELFGYDLINFEKQIYIEFVSKVNELIKVFYNEISENEFYNMINTNKFECLSKKIDEHTENLLSFWGGSNYYPDGIKELYYDNESYDYVDLNLNTVLMNKSEQKFFIEYNKENDLDEYHKKLLELEDCTELSLWSHVYKSINKKFEKPEKDDLMLIPVIQYYLNSWDLVEDENKYKEFIRVEIIRCLGRHSNLPEYVYHSMRDFIPNIEDDFYIYDFKFKEMINYLKIKYGIKCFHNIITIQHLSMFLLSELEIIMNKCVELFRYFIDNYKSDVVKYLKNKIKVLRNLINEKISIPRTNSINDVIGSIKEAEIKIGINIFTMFFNILSDINITDVKKRIKVKLNLLKNSSFYKNEEYKRIIDDTSKLTKFEEFDVNEKHLDYLLGLLY